MSQPALGQLARGKPYGLTSWGGWGSGFLWIQGEDTGTTAVGKSVGLLWDLRAAIGDPSVLRWDVKTAIGDPLQLVWDVSDATAVGDAVQLVWDIRTAIGDPLVLRWDVESDVAITYAGWGMHI